MMRSIALVLVLLLCNVGRGDLPTPLVKELSHPHGVIAGPDGTIYVSVQGVPGKAGDGSIVVIREGKATPLAANLDDPRGLILWKGKLVVADGPSLLTIDQQGKSEVLLGREAFPQPIHTLTTLAVEPDGSLLVVDAGRPRKFEGGLYRITASKEVTRLGELERAPGLKTTTGLLSLSAENLLMLDGRAGELHYLATRGSLPWLRVDSHLDQAAGLAIDTHGRVYIGCRKKGKGAVVQTTRLGARQVVLASGFQAISDLCLDAQGKNILVVDQKAGTLTAVPCQNPTAPVEQSSLKLSMEPAFPELIFEGVKEGETVKPVVLTHAGDGSNRLFVATQDGVVHVFSNDGKARKTKVFLDLRERVNAEPGRDGGILGMAFPPRFKEQRYVLVYYARKGAGQFGGTNVLSRFLIDEKDPDRAVLQTERSLYTVPRIQGSCQGGGLVIGSDGLVYLAVGAGQTGMPPSSSFMSIHGAVLCLDIAGGLEARGAATNPFHRQSFGKDEVWALGFRNVRQLTLDRKTSRLWGIDVGERVQEINLIEREQRYGWPYHEGSIARIPFSSQYTSRGTGPVWEYGRELGTAGVGGVIYRGKNLPELDGAYLHGDQESGRIWGLWYDPDRKRVTAHRQLGDWKLPVMALGEDEAGEVLALTWASGSKCIQRLQAGK